MNKLNEQFNSLSSFPDSIAVIDFNGQIVFTNASWQQFSRDNGGLICKTGIGINYLELCEQVKGHERQMALDAREGILKVIQGELPAFEMEYPCHSPQEQRWFILRVVPLHGYNQLSLVTHINISRRKLAEEQLEKTNKQLHELNIGLNTNMFKMVHDLQGPLNSIEGLISLTKNESNQKEIKNYFSLIESSVQNLKKYIQLNIKRSAENNLIEVIDFNKLLNEFYESIKFSQVLNFVQLKIEVHQSCEFSSNKGDILCLVSNLVMNSLKYHDAEKAQPSVLIQVQVNEKEAILTISDNGIGIKEDVLPKIFELNFQVEKNNQSGAGIGLYLVKKSINQLKGQLNIQSTLGEGTQVSITIPNQTVKALAN